MRTSTRILALVGLLAILAASTIAFGRSHAQAQIDISGDWNVTLEGDIATTCTIGFAQSDADLSAILNCAGVGTGSFTGAIDPATGEFNLSGVLIVSVELEGAVSEDGTAISGTWNASGFLSGTFTGTRDETPSETQPVPAAITLTGDWNATFEGFLSGTCAVAIQQSGLDLFVAMECAQVGSGVLNGSIDPVDGRFTLSGNLSGLPAALAGVASEDGTFIEGTWVAAAVFSGTFEGALKDRTPSFIDVTGTWNIVLSPLEGESPEIGFSDTCVASIEQSLVDLAATIDCDELGSGVLSGTINPLTGRLFLDEAPNELIGMFEGTASESGESLSGTWLNPSRTLVSGFTADRKSGPRGDVNCDATVNSIDAALLLQYDAGLLGSLGCPEFAD